jgi:flavin-dependent dehydrogenase
MNDPSTSFDVAIIGGGLAGLTLALQLIRESPGLAIVVLERSHFPPPAAAHKVGESTVEVGAHYLSHTLGLKSLLECTQLRKFGLRFFFGGTRDNDLADADELGASKFLPVISYQLDRGILEADLAGIISQRGVHVIDNCVVKQATVRAAGSDHELKIIHEDRPQVLRCRWLVDASARSAVLNRSLNLGKPSKHRMCAAWFRLDGVIDVDEWSDSASWKSRCSQSARRLSTNHLMGSGYWAWIIPLVGNRTSVGLVTDPDIHPSSSYNNFNKFQNWTASFEPHLAGQIANARHTLMDIKLLNNLSRDCKQVWSGDRWALTGESGLFTDPFYSPGTDFIAIGNTFICDLITRQRSQGELGIHATVYQKMYRSFYLNTMRLYERQYAGFGDTRLMVVKTTWDYAYYWSVLAWLFFREMLTDVSFVKAIQADLIRMSDLNTSIQAEFSGRAATKRAARGMGRFFDQCAIPVLAELNAALLQRASGNELEFRNNCDRLEVLAPQLLSMLSGTAPGAKGQSSLLGDLNDRFS